MSGVVIIGAGHAGGTAASLLRQYGYPGPVTLVGEEMLAPYQRPPLSKAWLAGRADADSLALKPLDYYAQNGIDFRPGIQAVAVSGLEKQVALSDGTVLAYDQLIIATGAAPIRLQVPGADLGGVLFLRTAADAEALKAAIGPGKRLAVVGGGYIGLEVAASGRALGAEVVVIEREPRLLARVACQPLSDFFLNVHQGHAVRFELGSEVVGFAGRDGHVAAMDLSDGREVPCDAVVVGVGARPNDQLARDAGLECDGGIVVDLDARSVSDPHVFAIGDVARCPAPLYDRMLRLESVPNALEQAKQASSAITGRPRPAGDCPWQWSDQYDIKLQIAGYALGADDIVLRGDPTRPGFAVFHLAGDRVRSVEAVNAPAEFMAGKSLILSGRPVDRAKLRDPTVSMKIVAAG